MHGKRFRFAAGAILTFLPLMLLIGGPRAEAQTDEFAAGLVLNGLAVHEQLRHDYYIGALFTPAPAPTTDDALLMPGPKRMDVRVVTESWSPRRFAQMWNQLILINNPEATGKDVADEILAFTNLPKNDLRAGDQLRIDLVPDRGTVISLNDIALLKTSDDTLFKLLLNCWVGARPPSSAFKQDILKRSNSDSTANLMTMFEITAPTANRRAEIEAWKSDRVATAAAKPAAAPTPAPPKAEPVAAGISASEQARREGAEKNRLAALALEQERQRLQELERARKEAAAQARAEEARRGLITQYSTDMVKASYRFVRYPKRALKLNQEGTVLLEVVLNREGEVVSSKVTQSSGYPALDDAAIEAVQKSSPFPAIPREIAGDKIEFTLPFTFQISG